MLKRLWKKGNPLALLVGMKTDTATMEESMETPQKTSNKSTYDPSIPLLGIYPEENNVKKTHVPSVHCRLCTIARAMKQSRCPSTDEWIKKQWYIYTIEYYSAKKWNVFESVLMR